MTQLAPVQRVSADVFALLLAASFVVVAILAGLMLEVLSTTHPASGGTFSSASQALPAPQTETAGMLALLPFAGVSALMLLAGAAVVFGRRRFAARA